MEHYQIINIKEVLEKNEGVAYQGEIGVFVPNNTMTLLWQKEILYMSMPFLMCWYWEEVLIYR